ncbi:MAG: A/G-specific adenine glycosylase [Anaerolineae bacterium]|nr:A/G-specific adenine glycosylase [Anaerolineae bacterium]
MTPAPTFQPELLAWYQAVAAALPWRANRDPYRVWLAEMMLQQTQVATVIPYYERFLAAFPTVEALAAAPRDQVLKLWEGLGYYSRARHLHAAAQTLVAQHGGQFPQTPQALMALPGIGRYTAGAIASIAFDQRAPVLDGNVVRVFARLFDLEQDVTQAATQQALWAMAEHLVPQHDPGAYNQALMELGRTICKPRNPRCADCPIAAHCLARARGTQAQRPVKARKAPTPHYDVTAGLVRDGTGRLLIARRPEEKLLGGLWEFPGGKQEAGESLEACLARELAEELAIQVAVGPLFIRVKHAYTHFKITLHVFECRYLPEGGLPECLACTEWRWVTEHELEAFAFSAADRQVIAELRARPHKLL